LAGSGSIIEKMDIQHFEKSCLIQQTHYSDINLDQNLKPNLNYVLANKKVVQRLQNLIFPT